MADAQTDAALDGWLNRILSKIGNTAAAGVDSAAQKAEALVTGQEAAAPEAAATPLPSGKNQVSVEPQDGGGHQVVVDAKDGDVATREEAVIKPGEKTAFTSSTMSGTTGFDLAAAKREVGKQLLDEGNRIAARIKALDQRKGDPAAEQEKAQLASRRAAIVNDMTALKSADAASVVAIGGRAGLEIKPDDAARQGLKTGTLTIVKGTKGGGGDEVTSTETIQAWSDAEGNTVQHSVKTEGNKKTVTVTKDQADGGQAQFTQETDGKNGLLGGGMAGAQRSESQQFSTTDATGKTSSRSSSQQVQGGLKAEGTALGAGAQASSSKGATTKGGYTGKVEHTAGACYLADVAEMTPVFEGGAWVKKFEITLTIKINSKLSATGGKGGQSVTLGGAAEAALVFKQVLTEAQKVDYLGQAKAVDGGGKAKAGFPELKSLERLVALVRGGGDLGAGAAALVDSDFAKALPEGQSISLDLSGQVEGGAQVKAGAIGAQGSASKTWKRSVQVATGKADPGIPVVNVTLSFTTAQELGGGGSAMGAEFQVKGGDSQGNSFGFRLVQADPSYKGWFDQIKVLPTPDAAREFAQAHPELVASRSWTAGKTSQVGSGMAGEKGPKIVQSSSLEDSAQVEGGKVTGSGKGSNAVDLGGVATSTDRMDATVDEDGGVSADVGTTTGVIDPLRGVQEFVGNLMGQTSNTAQDQGQAALAKGAQGALTDLLMKKYEDLKGYKINPTHFEEVVRRAADKKNWSNCSLSPRTLEPWETLRKTLVSPVPDGEWVKMDTSPDKQQSKQVARAHALAEFMSDYGYAAEEAIENVLRHWGEGPGHQTVNSGADLGGKYEWPSSLAKERAKFETVEGQVQAAAKTLAKLKGDAAAVHRYAQPLFADLTSVGEAVKASPDITSERARAEMTTKINGLIAQLRNEVDAAKAAAPAGGPAAAAGAATDAQAQAMQREIESVKKELWDMRQKEAKLLDAARGQLRAIHGGSLKDEDFLLGSVGATFSEDVVAAVKVLSEVSDLHEYWITRILRLRELYGTAATPESLRVVGMDAKAPRNANYEPHIEDLIKIHQSACDAQTGNSSKDPMNTRVYAQWRERAKY
ncbi:MAG: hypothetical protein JNN18_09765 [Rubrivivax sp.]|nr:hypothetical protein [Rubrivivax sp.]